MQLFFYGVFFVDYQCIPEYGDEPGGTIISFSKSTTSYSFFFHFLTVPIYLLQSLCYIKKLIIEKDF